MHSWLIRTSGLLLAILLVGCATTVNTNVKVSAAQVAKYNDLPDLDVVSTLEKNVNEARNANMPFLAPHYFREASKVLSECQNALGNKPKDVLVNNAARGDAILEKGRAVAAIVRYRFAKELELKQQLDALNTAKLLPKEYENVIGDLSRLIEKVESEQPADIEKDKDNLLKAMQDVEVKAIQEGALHESETINAESRKKNADKQVPVTFAEALRIYQEAKSRIAAAHNDEKLVQRLGAQALFAARHAQQINERVTLLQTQFKLITGGGGTSLSGVIGGVTGAQLGMQVDGKPSAMDNITVEKIVLQEEDRLLGISTAMGLKDLRDLPLEKQVEEIKRAAGDNIRQPRNEASAASMQDLDARLKASNAAAQQAIAELAAKDKQLKETILQVEAQAAQLAEKDAQIQTLGDKVVQLEDAAKEAATKSSSEPKAAKTKAANSKKQ